MNKFIRINGSLYEAVSELLESGNDLWDFEKSLKELDKLSSSHDGETLFDSIVNNDQLISDIITNFANHKEELESLGINIYKMETILEDIEHIITSEIYDDCQ